MMNVVTAQNLFIFMSTFGYIICEDDFFDKPAFLYLLNEKVCRIDYDDITSSSSQVSPICKYGETGKHFTMDVRSNNLYLVLVQDENSDTIFTVKQGLDSGSGREVLADYFEFVTAMTYDWIGGNLLWVDYTENFIGLYNEGMDDYIPLLTTKKTPFGVAIDIQTGRLFWSDVTPSISWILFGTSAVNVFIDANLGFPTDICIDHTDRRIYWMDNIKLTISSTDISLDTASDIKQVTTMDLLGYGMAVSEEYIFWTDNAGAHVILKLNGQRVKDFPLDGTKGDVFLNNLYSQPNVRNGCELDNGGCDHICVPAPSSEHTCLCKVGYHLGDDNRHCLTEVLQDEFLLVCDSYHDTIYQVGIDGGPIYDIPLAVHLTQPIAVLYDHVNEFVYLTDVGNKEVYRFSLNDPTFVHTVKTFNSTAILGGIALDINTDTVYVTDEGNNCIYKMNLDGSNLEIIVHNANNPRAIQLENRYRYIYWTEWSDASIRRASMEDGSLKDTVVSGDMTYPNGLTIDEAGDKMYWCDAGTETLEAAYLSGKNRKVLKTFTNLHFFGMVKVGQYLYITDWKNKTIHKFDKNSGQVSQGDYGEFGRPNGITGYTKQKTTPARISEYTTTLNAFSYSTGRPTSYNVFGNNAPLDPPAIYSLIGVGGLLVLAAIVTVGIICGLKHRRRNQRNNGHLNELRIVRRGTDVSDDEATQYTRLSSRTGSISSKTNMSISDRSISSAVTSSTAVTWNSFEQPNYCESVENDYQIPVDNTLPMRRY